MGKAKILVVDDEDDVRNSIIAFLGALGYDSVDFASNADDGVKMAQKKGYDLVILDMMMPKKSGWGFMEDMKSKKVKTRILVLSAVGLPNVVREDIKKKYPNVEFLSKVNITNQLEDSINDIMKSPAGVI